MKEGLDLTKLSIYPEGPGDGWGGRGETEPGAFVGLSVVDAHMGWQLDLAIILI